MRRTVDLHDVPVVDNHCHSLERVPGVADVASWAAVFSESHDADMRSQATRDTAFYARLVRELAALLDVAPDEQAVLAARNAHDPDGLASLLLRDAGIGALVVDTGFPPPSAALAPDELGRTAGCPAVGLLRLELLFQDLVAAAESLDGLRAAVRSALTGARAQGWSGFKSIVAYRTGLDVHVWPEADAVAAFAAARQEVETTGTVRLGHKPLLDTLLADAFDVAAAQGLPVQFHVGYGDPDADLRRASPLLLRDVLEHAPWRDLPVVLLHGCWPYTREGAYLAAVYPNAHLDLSYAIPFLSRQEMRDMTRAALGVAPTSKLMYSSDGARVPELHWSGAHEGRRALGAVLGELVDDGDLSSAQARRAGEQVLRDNATVLYGLGG
jgi:hypothetical protein